MVLQVRMLTDEERQQLTRRSQSRSAAVRDVERARIILQANQGQRVPAIARTLGLCEPTVRLWIKRFNERGLAGVAEAAPRGPARIKQPGQVAPGVGSAPSDPPAPGPP